MIGKSGELTWLRSSESSASSALATRGSLRSGRDGRSDSVQVEGECREINQNRPFFFGDGPLDVGDDAGDVYTTDQDVVLMK